MTPSTGASTAGTATRSGCARCWPSWHSSATAAKPSEGGILHYQRSGDAETAEIIVNRTEHIIVEPLASGKHTEVNPMGFTIVVEEIGHNPDHSYYDYQ